MRDVILVRVSRDEQAGAEHYSLPMQEEKTRAYSAASNGTVLELFSEVQTSWTDDIEKRPVLQAALDFAIQNHADRFIVYRLDRFARDKYVFFYADRLLRRAGIQLCSASEYFADGDDGETLKGFYAVMAHAESSRLSQRVSDSLRQKMQQGRWAGWNPFGYRREQGRLVVDEPARAGYLLAVQALLEGAPTFREIANLLNAAGYRTTRGHPWRSTSVAGMLRSPAYLGLVVTADGAAIPGEHQALLERVEWERVQARCREMAGHHLGIPRGRGGYPLSGLLDCARCGGRMVGMAFGRNRYRVYFCSTRMRHGRAGCTAPSFHAAAVEELIALELDALQLPADWQEEISQEAGPEEGTGDPLAAVAGEEKRIVQLYQDGYVSYEDFQLRWRKLQEKRDAATPPPAGEVRDMADRLALGIGRLWREAPDDLARRALALALFVGIVVGGESSAAPLIRHITWRPALAQVLGLAENG